MNLDYGYLAFFNKINSAFNYLFKTRNSGYKINSKLFPIINSIFFIKNNSNSLSSLFQDFSFLIDLKHFFLDYSYNKNYGSKKNYTFVS